MFSHYIYKSQGSLLLYSNITYAPLKRPPHHPQPPKKIYRGHFFFGKNLVKGFPVQDICLRKFNWLACDLGNSVKGLLAGIRQIIQNYYVITGILEVLQLYGFQCILHRLLLKLP